jgi:hypothetical protein
VNDVRGACVLYSTPPLMNVFSIGKQQGREETGVDVRNKLGTYLSYMYIYLLIYIYIYVYIYI